MNVRVPLILQAAPADCGPACAAMVLSSKHRRPLSVAEIDELGLQASRDGMSVADLRRAIRNGGMEMKTLRINKIQSLASMPRPQILYWDSNHFVVAEAYARKYVAIADPAFGRRRVDWDEFAQHFTNIAMVPAEATAGQRGGLRQQHKRGKFRINYMLQLSQREYRRRLIGIGIATVCLDAIALSTIFLLRYILAHVGVTAVGALIATLVALATVEVVGLGLRGVLIARTQTATETRMHTELFQGLLRLDWTFFVRRSKGDLLSRLEFVRELYSRLFHDYVLAIFGLATSVFALAGLAAVNVRVAAALMAITAVCFGAGYVFRESFVSIASSAVEARVRLGSFSDEVLHGLEGLKGVRAERAIGEAWRTRRSRLAAVSRQVRLQTGILDAIQSVVVRVAQVIVVAVVAATASNQASTGNLVAILSLSGMALTPILIAIRNYITWGELESYVTRYNELLERCPSVQREIGSGGKFECMSVNDVSFAFGGGRNIIENLSFEIHRGEHIGIQAPSGTGKSTLLRIISGSLKPTRGSVMVNDRPLDEAVEKGFFCGIVPQEITLISGTIAENLRMAAPHATDEDLLHACAAAGLGRDLDRMPNGLYTRLAVNGGGISGGQRQRIAIARALLSSPDLLLLDEATAALDFETEASIIRNLRGKTLVVVSHREDLMNMMDHIISLDVIR
jgi:ATP-binding cassette, subfamily B, bacterial